MSATHTLFYAAASPFVRKVLVLLHETGQRERVALEEVTPTPVAPIRQLNASNPAGKIPAPRLPDGHRVLLYVYEGSLTVEGERPVEIATNRLARLSEEGELSLRSEAGARVLVLAGKPLREPIVQYGPFVMNSREEIEQALRDYRDGVLAV